MSRNVNNKYSQVEQPRKLVIFGTGGIAREMFQIIEDINEMYGGQIEFLGWLEGNAERIGQQVHGYPVLGGAEWLTEHKDVEVAVGIGAPQYRKKVVGELEKLGVTKFANLIHPQACLGNRIEMGHGITICAGVVGTTDFKIGNHVLVNISVTLAHEDDISDFVTIAPSANISGSVNIGEGCDIGTNATVIQGISIGEWSIVGAGAVVTREIPANVTAVGAPAKVIKEREAGWQNLT